MIKAFKSLVISIITILAIAAPFFYVSNSAFADDPSYFKQREGGCNYILGMVSWDCGVDVKDEESLKAGIWTVASNVAVDLTVLAAYLVIGYVIYGGYLYMLSGGDPGKVATGKKAIMQAFIGLAIVILSNVILNTIRIALGVNSFAQNCAENACVTSVDDMVIGAINWVIGVAGVVAVIFVVYGGISFMTASGDPAKVKRAKDAILYSCIGLAIVALAFSITAFVSGLIRKQNSAYLPPINNTIISKEINQNVKTL